jgi:hypothetical protein
MCVTVVFTTKSLQFPTVYIEALLTWSISKAGGSHIISCLTDEQRINGYPVYL